MAGHVPGGLRLLLVPAALAAGLQAANRSQALPGPPSGDAGGQRRPLREAFPRFLLCETERGVPCHKTAPTRWLGDFHRLIGEHMAKLAAAGRRPVILHVGANDFTDDVRDYRPLVQAVPLPRGSFRVVLVEPDPGLTPRLRKVGPQLGLGWDDVQVVDAAIKANCTEGVRMYQFADRMFEDFVPEWARTSVRLSLESWRSFDRLHPLRALADVAPPSIVDQAGLDGDGFNVFHRVVVPFARRIYAAGNASAYLEARPVRCLEPPGLLREAGAAGGDLAAVTVDAEGEDGGIVLGLLGAGLEPAYLKFEGHEGSPSARLIIERLEGRGYLVGKSFQAHSTDIVAVARDAE